MKGGGQRSENEDHNPLRHGYHISRRPGDQKRSLSPTTGKGHFLCGPPHAVCFPARHGPNPFPQRTGSHPEGEQHPSVSIPHAWGPGETGLFYGFWPAPKKDDLFPLCGEGDWGGSRWLQAGKAPPWSRGHSVMLHYKPSVRSAPPGLQASTSSSSQIRWPAQGQAPSPATGRTWP